MDKIAGLLVQRQEHVHGVVLESAVDLDIVLQATVCPPKE
jgi:hypothetical protein